MVKEEYLKEFGNRIKQLRRLNGFTQKELATKCGYKSESSNSTINKIESGKLDVSITKLKEFSDIFGVSAAYLLGEGDGQEEARKLSQLNAMNIMDKRLSDQEKSDLMNGLELYFSQKLGSSSSAEQEQ